MGKRYCVFASYSKENKIGDDVIFYLKELNKITDGIVFIMDNPIDKTEEKKLEGLTIYHKCEKHNEYDFGSYKRGFFYLKENGFLDDTSEIVFANDSCFGPLKPLNLFIKKWEKENKPDLYGITINNYGPKYSTEPIINRFEPHIQSYFFLVSKNLFNSAPFIEFLKSVKHYDDVNSVIKNYELGLTRLAKGNGFTYGAFFNCKGLKENSTIDGSKVFEVIKNGFFVKKKCFAVYNNGNNIINYFVQKGIFPYVINEDGGLTENKPKLKIVFLLKFIIRKLMQKIFNVKNEGCAKIYTILGIPFKIKRYDYEISNIQNSVKYVYGKKYKTLKERKIKGLEIKIKGKDNEILLNPEIEFKNSKIEINANNCIIKLNSKFPISNFNLKFEKENYQSFIVEENVKINGLNITSNKEDVLIEIKNNTNINNNAEFKIYNDEENRPRILIEPKGN